MASTLSGLISTLKADLARPDGSGSYVHDLSGADQVKVGEYGRPWRTGVPVACLWLDDLASEFGAPLGQYARRARFRWRAWAPLTTDDLEVGETTAADLLADLLLAIEVDRKKGIGATLMLGGGAAFVGPIEGSGARYAQVAGQIELTYRVTTGG